MLRALPIILALAVILSFGVVHGIWTDRWALSDEPQASAAKLPRVPLTLGEWSATENELDARQVEIADIAGYITRSYVNARTGTSLTLLIVCGRPGPVSVHTPDVCYGGAGFRMVGSRREAFPYDGGPAPAEFRVGLFRKVQAMGETHLRILWSWSPDGTWRLPDNPRWTFAGAKALYKMYVVRELAKGDEPLQEDPAVEFLGLLLPELQKALFTN
jgi:hypothetical protein